MNPDDPRHGTEAGHAQHERDRETPCPPCHNAKILAARRRTKRRTMGHRYLVPIGERVHANLAELRTRGATHEDIAEWAGIVASQAWRCCTSDPTALVYARTKRKLLMMKPGRLITPIGITRRLQGLARLGYSAPAIAAASGVHRDTVADAMRGPRNFLAARVREQLADAYDRLSMRLPEGETQQDRAGISRSRNAAERKGWPAPLSWDDETIDDPRAKPATTTAEGRRAAYDEVVVLRVMAGEHLPMTAAERREVVQRLRDRGLSYTEIERHTGITKVDRHVKREVAA